MSKPEITWYRFAVLSILIAIGFTLNAGTSKATGSQPAAGAFTDPDLINEARTLETYAIDLFKFDKKCAELKKRQSASPGEIDPLQRIADDLRGRLPGVQNALREIVRKLKAANQWADLDAKVLAKITDAKSQTRFRQESFKQTLELASSQLSNSASEINQPLVVLRRKLTGQTGSPVRELPLAFRAVRVAYEPAAAMFTVTFRCRLAHLRVGISGFVHGSATADATYNEDCQCGTPFDQANPCLD